MGLLCGEGVIDGIKGNRKRNERSPPLFYSPPSPSARVHERTPKIFLSVYGAFFFIRESTRARSVLVIVITDRRAEAVAWRHAKEN